MTELRCPACTADPDPRGSAACYECRLLNEPMMANPYGRMRAERDALTAEAATLKARVTELEQESEMLHCKLETWESIAERDHGAPIETVERMRADIDELTYLNQNMRSERDALRAEVERMRPVYEAAVEWSESFGELSKRLPPHVHKLRDAVDAAEQKERGR